MFILSLSYFRAARFKTHMLFVYSGDLLLFSWHERKVIC